MKNLDNATAVRYIQIRDRCRSKGIKFDLTLVQIKNMLRAKKCQLSGMPINGLPSIDRLDPSKGYVTGNVVAADRGFNSRKGDLTPAEIESLYKVLKKKGLI